MRAPNPFADRAVAESYDGWFQTPLGAVVSRLERALIWRLAAPRPGERALEVGAGTGHWALPLARQGLHVVALEPAPQMLDAGRRKGAAVRWLRGEAEHLPLAVGAFDLVLAVTVLEFVTDPERAVAEMARVSRPGGRLVVAAINAQSTWAEVYRREAENQASPYAHARFYSRDDLLGLLRPLGRVRWGSAVFMRPDGRGIGLAGPLDWLGSRLLPARGAMLVARVER